MDTEHHIRAVECESTYDRIRTIWAERVTGASSTTEAEKGAVAVLHEVGCVKRASGQHLRTGWALKQQHRAVRMTPEVKAYLLNKFNSGSLSGQKADPVQVHRY